MTSYSVADAKAGLPRLINEALAGEEVIITRHGKPVVTLQAAVSEPRPGAAQIALRRLLDRRGPAPPGAPTSVELLNLIYDEPDA